jgi:DNA-binding IclR family transcriptional regulator
MTIGAAGDSVLARSFAILDAFGVGGEELTLEQLVERTGLPRSTAHRLATQLKAHGALETTRRGWRLGLRLFELGQLVVSQQGLREIALPHMNDLYESTHATIQLGVLDDTEVVYVEVISGHDAVATPSRRGGRMPAHCTAIGKVLVAFSDPATERLLGTELPSRTRRTITDPEMLRRELAEVRRSGVAFDAEESRLGLRCVAAPIVGVDRRVIAALSISFSSPGRLTPQLAEPALRMAALGLRRALAERGLRAA